MAFTNYYNFNNSGANTQSSYVNTGASYGSSNGPFPTNTGPYSQTLPGAGPSSPSGNKPFAPSAGAAFGGQALGMGMDAITSQQNTGGGRFSGVTGINQTGTGAVLNTAGNAGMSSGYAPFVVGGALAKWGGNTADVVADLGKGYDNVSEENYVVDVDASGRPVYSVGGQLKDLRSEGADISNINTSDAAKNVNKKMFYATPLAPVLGGFAKRKAQDEKEHLQKQHAEKVRRFRQAQARYSSSLAVYQENSFATRQQRELLERRFNA